MTGRRLLAVIALGSLGAGVVLAAPYIARAPGSRFPHEKHAKVFPLCSSCHAGVTEPGKSIWPEPVRCESCHDGVVAQKVTWQPRVGPRRGNRRFTHHAHDSAATVKDIADSALITNCSSCHNEAGAARMVVRNAVVTKCFSCHNITAPHFDAPPQTCATCHVRLTDAPGFTREEIAAFPKPASHDAPDFVLGGHGRLARLTGNSGSQRGISASCATCHARNLCLSCHVNALESPVISSLAMDSRSPHYSVSLIAPPGHRSPDFLRTHGREAQRGRLNCATCHARESCLTCHVGAGGRTIAALPVSGPGRAAGVHLTRRPPRTHTLDFRERHGPEANARPRSCETCHTRPACLECHRGDVGPQSRYHPQNFVTRHPSAAYAREANCVDCHNAAQFCQACHQQSGLTASRRLGARGYHDAFRGFSLGHGQAARQSLESCASCHAERDCTACHSAVAGGFRFNPHGPGFNAARMKSKNPTVCFACHGRTIPEGD